MARPKKLKNTEAAVIVREQDGVKITSIGVVYGRKVNLGNYDSANLEVSVWADMAGEDDAKIPEVMQQLWALARGDVESQPEMNGKVLATPPAQHVASAPPIDPAKPAPTGHFEPGPPPVQSLSAPPAKSATSGTGRTLTRPISSYGKAQKTAGVSTETFANLLMLTPEFEKLTGKGSAMTELSTLCPDAWVLHEGERRYTRLALTEEEGLLLLSRFRTVTQKVRRAEPAEPPPPDDEDMPPEPDFDNDAREYD